MNYLSKSNIHSELLSEIRELDKTILTYKSLNDENTGKALTETVDKLYQQAGMTDIEGPGIINQSPAFRGKCRIWNTDYRNFT